MKHLCCQGKTLKQSVGNWIEDMDPNCVVFFSCTWMYIIDSVHNTVPTANTKVLTWNVMNICMILKVS